MQLWQKVLIGLVSGVVLGFTLGEQAIYLKPFGEIFIRLIKMIIVPLVFFAIVSGIINVPDTSSLGRIGVKALITYLCTTVFAITVGLTVGMMFEPGSGLDLTFNTTAIDPMPAASGFLKVSQAVLNIIPENAIDAMSKGNMLQVVFFAFFIGMGLSAVDKESSLKLGDAFRLMSSFMFALVGMVIKLSPLAACCLTAWVIGVQGSDVLQKLLKLVGCTYFAFGIQYMVFGLLIYGWTRMSPIPFFRKSIEYQTIAFSTTSSKAALPTTMSVCRNRLGVSEVSSSFVLPLGASINMDGTAICISLFSLFLAQATGKVLTPNDYVCMIAMGTLGSIGAAGIPGGTIVMLPMVLGSIGVPIEGIALIAGIDRITDMMRTTISITGDAVVTLCVDHSENMLDKEVYYSDI